MICSFCGAHAPDAPYCCCCGASQNAVTLGQLYFRWSQMHYRTIGYKCKAGYESAWNTLSDLWERPFASITLEDYQTAMDSLASHSLSLQKKLRSLISQLCNYAPISLKTPLCNYAPYLILDGKKNKSRDIFSDEEISRLFLYVRNNGKYAWDAEILLILIFTGLRQEELFQIKKQNVNMRYQCIAADGSKTEAGRNRLLPIVPVIAPYIFSYMLRSAGSEYLITTTRGCQINLTNWRSRRYYPMLRDCEITSPDDEQRLVPYCARHTYATLADRAGVDKDTLAKLIGHSSYKTTKSIYIHERLDQVRQETDKVERLAQHFIA